MVIDGSVFVVFLYISPWCLGGGVCFGGDGIEDHLEVFGCGCVVDSAEFTWTDGRGLAVVSSHVSLVSYVCYTVVVAFILVDAASSNDVVKRRCGQLTKRGSVVWCIFGDIVWRWVDTVLAVYHIQNSGGFVTADSLCFKDG